MAGRLDEAIAMAVKAHAGQVDKGGAPYILHPLRVMLAQDTVEAQIVGVLHDVVEDSDVPLHFVAWTFGGEIADAVDAVTRRDGEDYFTYVERAGSNQIGRKVKVADLRDNLRGPPIPLHERYRKALAMLGATPS